MTNKLLFFRNNLLKIDELIMKSRSYSEESLILNENSQAGPEKSS